MNQLFNFMKLISMSVIVGILLNTMAVPAETPPSTEVANEKIMLDGFHDLPMSEMARLYEAISKKTVWLHASVDPFVDFDAPREMISRVDACNLIRQALLENYGIAVTEINDREVFIDWTTNAKFKAFRERTEKASENLPLAK